MKKSAKMYIRLNIEYHNKLIQNIHDSYNNNLALSNITIILNNKLNELNNLFQKYNTSIYDNYIGNAMINELVNLEKKGSIILLMLQEKINEFNNLYNELCAIELLKRRRYILPSKKKYMKEYIAEQFVKITFKGSEIQKEEQQYINEYRIIISSIEQFNINKFFNELKIYSDNKYIVEEEIKQFKKYNSYYIT